MRYLECLQPLALLALRVVLGVIMIGHGYPRLFALSHQVQGIRGLGLPGWLAYFSVAAEFLGGIALILGLFTRIAALGIVIDMAVAIEKVHWKNGLLGKGGYEFPLSLVAIAFALIFLGAGPIALDSVRRGGVSKKAQVLRIRSVLCYPAHAEKRAGWPRRPESQSSFIPDTGDQPWASVNAPLRNFSELSG